MSASKPSSPAPSSALAAVLGLAASLGLGYLALSQRLPAPAAPGFSTAPQLGPCLMDRDGYWQGRLFAAESLSLDWQGKALECAGNARPNAQGLRLFFAGRPGPAPDRLLFVIGIAVDIGDLAGREHPASVTLVDESSSQFFHSAVGRCFTRIGAVHALPGRTASYRVDGELYCAGAIAAVSSTASVTLGDVRFSGRLDLGDD